VVHAQIPQIYTDQITIPVGSLTSSKVLLHFTSGRTGAWLLVGRVLGPFSILLLQHLKLKNVISECLEE